MELAEVDDKVISILAEQALLDKEDVTRSSSPEELGIDSLGLVETIFAIEETFDISVPFNANDPGEGDFDISTVDDIIRGVRALVTEQRA